MASTARALEILIQPATLALLGGAPVVLESTTRKTSAEAGEARLHRSFRLKYAAVENLAKFLGESAIRLMRIIESNERTAQRRKEQGTLNAEESDRIARIARVVQRAVEAFGDRRQAREWIKRPNRTFRGFAPLGLLNTDAGAALVTDELGRIEYGDPLLVLLWRRSNVLLPRIRTFASSGRWSVVPFLGRPVQSIFFRR
jgi:putative toxin-antitoxin system antitoxin component (TIGR02293 family)